MTIATDARHKSCTELLQFKNLTVGFSLITDIDLLHRWWIDLETRSDATFFQSWGWVGSWLRSLPAERRPFALVVRDAAGVIVGLALLGKCHSLRHRLVRSLGYYLLETGEPQYDCLTIEYNGLLVERGRLDEVAGACMAALIGHSNHWDELFLSGVDAAQSAAFEAAGRSQRLVHRVLYEKVCHFVDLDAVRLSGKYLDAIGQNTRYQIRRALKIYEKEGPVEFENARSVDEALDFLSGLKDLHQHYWQQRGLPGSFANPFFERFHRQLISERFVAGEIQLARIKASSKVIGYLYNLVFKGTVYAYQSGFQYEADNKRKPGLVSHYLAIDHHLKSGAHVYDFMAGEGQHKNSMSTQARSLFWLVEQRDRYKFRIEESLRRWKQRLAPQ